MSTQHPTWARRASLVAPGLLAAGALALTACTPSIPGEPEGGSDETMTILLSDTVDSIDPVLALSTGGRQSTWFAYESLVRYDPETGEAAPGIAEDFSYDPTSAHFVIREGVTCADGSEITAGTVARNFERWKDPATNAPLVNNMFGDNQFTVEYDDEARTVDLDLSSTPNPFRGAVPAFTQLGIICDSGLENPESLAKASDGTGPYAITDYVVGSHVTLQRNDDYAWAPLDDFDIEELPKTLRLNIVAEADTQVNLLLGGDADAALLKAVDIERLEGEAFTTQISSTGVMMMLANENEGLAGADVAVRRALAQAIDFDELATVQGQGTYAATFLRAPDNVCVDEQAIADVFPTGGVDAAAETLAKAGYAKNDGGVLEKDGVPVEVTLLGIELTSASAELIMSKWQELGVQVTYDDRGPGQAIDMLSSGTGWDSAFVSFQTDTPTGFRQFFLAPAAPDGPNFGNVQNPDYASLQGQASQLAGTDGCELWVQAEASIVERADWVPALASDDSWVLADGVSFFNEGAFVDPLTLRKN